MQNLGQVTDAKDIATKEYVDHYGICSTAAATAAKEVTISGVTGLAAGVTIAVKFDNAQSYNGVPTLNVNGLGAKNIRRVSGTNAARYEWQAGEVLTLTYDGTYWVIHDGGIATTTYYGATKLATSAVSTSTALALTPASLNSLAETMIAGCAVYSSSKTYAVGDRVRYNYGVYECVTAITTAESWTAAHWRLMDSLQEQVDGKVNTADYAPVTKTSDMTQAVGKDANGQLWTKSSSYTISVTAQTQDGVTVTGQTVTMRAGGPDGPVYATAAYEGQPVSFSVPDGFVYFASITSTLPSHFNPTTASGVISGANVSVVLTYSDFSTIRTAADIKAALDANVDLTDLVGESITCKRDGVTLTWDVADYSNDTITLLLHDTLPTNMPVEPGQALAYFENGLAAGAYKYKWGETYQYFTLRNDIPSGGQLKANNSTYQVYASQSDTAPQESGTVSTTEIAGAVYLGSDGSGMLNHRDRVNYSSNNFGESGLLQWLNSSAPANTQMPRITKFSRPYSVAQPGFMSGMDADFLAALDETVWKCSANIEYECPAALGGIAVKSNPYTVTYKFGLASEMEIFGSYAGVADGSTVFDIFDGASADDRKKYYNGAVRNWWLRSPYMYYPGYVRFVTTSGGVDVNLSYNSYGVVPACKISKSSEA